MRNGVLQLQVMLVVDSFLTLVTWLPYNIYPPVIEAAARSKADVYDDPSADIRGFRILTALMLTNVFSTPIVYFIFNRHFRVSTRKWALISLYL